MRERAWPAECRSAAGIPLAEYPIGRGGRIATNRRSAPCRRSRDRAAGAARSQLPRANASDDHGFVGVDDEVLTNRS